MLTTIGSTALITVAGTDNIPAKVDTGADSSSIWASNIRLTPDRALEFTLFAEGSPLYTGEVLRVDEFKIRQVRSSNGEISVRYLVSLPVVIEGRKISARFTLADRRRNHFPVLIGRKTLRGKFLVDVSRTPLPRRSTFNNRPLTQEFTDNPEIFHKKYFG